MRQLGKYRLLEPPASGGMAEVYRAEVAGPEGFVKEVALKVVRGDHAEGSEFARMFIQEARLASRLTHANIVHVFDFDRVEGRYCIAMELVHGRTLRAVVERCRERGARLGVARAAFVATEVAKALAYAHRPPEAGGVAGLVHRDVSPHNVLISFEVFARPRFGTVSPKLICQLMRRSIVNMSPKDGSSLWRYQGRSGNLTWR